MWLSHKTLAEAHNLSVGLALWIEVAAAFAAADGQRSQRVFEDLLKAQELDNGQIHRGVQAQAALIGADSAVELHTVAAIYMHAALIVHPGHTELNRAFRLGNALQNCVFLNSRILLHHRNQRLQHLAHSLQKFRLARISRGNTVINPLHIFVLEFHRWFPLSIAHAALHIQICFYYSKTSREYNSFLHHCVKFFEFFYRQSCKCLPVKN